MKKKIREKRLFGMAESLVKHLETVKDPIQPEDLVCWLGCHVPITDEENAEDVEETWGRNPEPSRGVSAIGKLRAALGFAPGDSLISVIEKAAEVCQEAGKRECVQCRGCKAFGTACGNCQKCKAEAKKYNGY